MSAIWNLNKAEGCPPRMDTLIIMTVVQKNIQVIFMSVCDMKPEKKDTSLIYVYLSNLQLSFFLQSKKINIIQQ